VTPRPRSTLITESNATALIDAVLREAAACGASDVHFESDADAFRVRLRIDGVLQVIATPPLDSRDTVLTRLKVLARMDIAEKRLPQDGRFSHTHGATTIDLRVSSLPTLHGEKLALRVLDLQQTLPKLDALGYEPDQLAHLQQALQGNHGLVLMTGPTGAGKTLSLYSCLQTLNRTEVNIHTLEDPIEVRLPGVNQVQMHERSGLGFAPTLRAVLRQDPDVIMLGEIRDRETADIALQAAQTGHLVLSTLHTADAPSTLARLQHMGVATHHIAASVRLIVAQRLVRRLCRHCRKPLSDKAQQAHLNALTEQDQRWLHPWLTSPTLFGAPGCARCHGGYRGRVGVFQVMPVSPAMQALLFDNASSHALAAQAARESVRSLRRSGWVKALQGVTTVDDVLHHTPADAA
jgi:type IV pilus assembly protein PilB